MKPTLTWGDAVHQEPHVHERRVTGFARRREEAGYL
jgi:hypothetical protein